MKRTLTLILVLLLFTACAPTAEQLAGPVQSTIAAIPTYTPYPINSPFPTNTPYPTNTPFSTYTPYPTYTLLPTQTPLVIVVTATNLPTPEFTPTNTLPPTATLDPTKTDKGGGFYLVGIDFAPGIWRNNGIADNCYWAITSKTGDILKNHFGMGGGTMNIPANGYQVEMKDTCGTWTFLEN